MATLTSLGPLSLSQRLTTDVTSLRAAVLGAGGELVAEGTTASSGLREVCMNNSSD